MSIFEWSLVIGLNVAIIAYGLWKSRETTKAVDWMLAARSLPWWMVGLSMFATAVDSGDYVAVTGAAYKNGMNFITDWWLGITIGWFILAWAIVLPMYRSGMFTNAEYLERRFGPAARVISVVVQVIYRTNVLGNVAYSLYLTFNILTGWGPMTWWLVVGIALGAAWYTASGGLKSVAVTDSIQSVVMLVAAVVVWVIVYRHVGGFAGMEQTLNEAGVDQRVSEAMLHVGKHLETGVPAWLVITGWIITLTAYCVVNHSQSMRLLAARSEWDVKMAAVSAAVVTAVVMWFNVSLGILGRGIEPNLESSQVDELFPRIVEQLLVPAGNGLAGIVVAGLLAGGISTFDSIGSALSTVFTRDLYARFLVRDASDRHYLRISQIVTFLVIGVSFIYIPFLKIGMVEFYLEMISVTVLPLMTVYLAGILTPAHRLSGVLGLAAGCSCGLARFICQQFPTLFAAGFPIWWTNKWWGFLWSIGATAAAMLLTTLVLGRARREQLAGLVVWLPADQTLVPDGPPTNWLDRTQRELVARMSGPSSQFDDPAAAGKQESSASTNQGLDQHALSSDQPGELPAHPFGTPSSRLPLWQQPWIWAVTVLAVMAWLNLVVLW